MDHDSVARRGPDIFVHSAIVCRQPAAEHRGIDPLLAGKTRCTGSAFCLPAHRLSGRDRGWRNRACCLVNFGNPPLSPEQGPRENRAPADMNRPRIAIPVPHSGDRAYAERALPQYEEAVRLAGGDPVRIELDQDAATITKQVQSCDGVLLPGSRADIDPQKYNEKPHPKTAAADLKRDTVDELLLQHAYQSSKPILGICYGLQALNVRCGGSLVQHIESQFNHAAGRAVANAHTVAIDPESRLGQIVGAEDGKTFAVNSSHHQSANKPGNGLRIVARSPSDGVIEALEGTAPDHFVLAVQWHPERSVNEAPELSGSARAIFEAFIQAAAQRH